MSTWTSFKADELAPIVNVPDTFVPASIVVEDNPPSVIVVPEGPPVPPPLPHPATNDTDDNIKHVTRTLQTVLSIPHSFRVHITKPYNYK
jgi:hypothetical protein